MLPVNIPPGWTADSVAMFAVLCRLDVSDALICALLGKTVRELDIVSFGLVIRQWALEISP